jgi:broad-specificity NMP kinase
MLRRILIAGVLGLGLTTYASAQEMMKCDDASMMKMQTEMDAMTDPAMAQQKDMAMKEMEMAKEAMAAKKTDECTMHMENASKEMMKK